MNIAGRINLVLGVLVVLSGVLLADGEVIFRDDFDKPALDKTWVWKPSPKGKTSYKIEDGCLVLINESGGGQWDKNTTSPKILRKVGSGNVMVTLKLVDYKPKQAWEEAGMFLWQDENNWFKFQVANNGKFVQLDCAGLVDGKAKEFRSPKYDQDSIYLRIKRKNAVIFFLYSKDGEKFVTLGLTRGAAYSDPQVGFFAARQPDHTKSNTVKIDFFEVKKID